MIYPENKKALEDPRNGTIEDLMELQYESSIVSTALYLYNNNLVTLEQALILAVQALHQSNKDLFQALVDLSSNKPPSPIVIIQEHNET